MIKGIIFDMDGVIVNTELIYYKRRRGLFTAHHLTPTDEKAIKLAMGMTLEECKAEWYKCWTGNDTLEEFSRLYDEYVASHKELDLAYGENRIKHVEEILVYLKENGYKTAVASSSSVDQIILAMEECEIIDKFDVLMSGELFEESKPNPKIYTDTMKLLGLKPEECLVVEDSPNGIKAARNAHAGYIVALRENLLGLDQSSADIIVDDLLEIENVLKDLNVAVCS